MFRPLNFPPILYVISVGIRPSVIFDGRFSSTLDRKPATDGDLRAPLLSFIWVLSLLDHRWVRYRTAVRCQMSDADCLLRLKIFCFGVAATSALALASQIYFRWIPTSVLGWARGGV